MSLNSKPIILCQNLIEDATLAATNTAAGYNVDNLFDRRPFQLWKAASAGTRYVTADLNKVLNPGFETGSFTLGWTAGDATMVNSGAASGTYAAKIAAAGADKTGPTSSSIEIDPAVMHRLTLYVKVENYSAGSAKAQFIFYDAEGNAISTHDLVTYSANQAWAKTTKTFGPSTGSPDITTPAGADTVKVRLITSGTATLDAFLDDVLLVPQIAPDMMGLAAHNFWSCNATVSLESSNDDTEAISSWAEQVAGFTPPNNLALIKTFTAPGTYQRAWRLKIVTANMAPSIGVWFVGPRITMPQYLESFDPRRENITAQGNVSQEGGYLGSVTEPVMTEYQFNFRALTDSFMSATFLPAWDSYLSKLMPFFFAWDITNHSTEAWYVTIPGNTTLDTAYDASRRNLNLTLQGVKGT